MVPGSLGGSEGSVTRGMQTQPAWWDGRRRKHQLAGGLDETALKNLSPQRARSPALSLFPLPSGFFLATGGPGGVFASRQLVGWDKREAKVFLPGTRASSPLSVQGLSPYVPRARGCWSVHMSS